MEKKVTGFCYLRQRRSPTPDVVRGGHRRAILLRPGRVIDATVGRWPPKATFRRSTAPKRSYRCALGSRSAGPTVTGAARTALDIATGQRVGDLRRRHRSPYFLRLPQRIDAQVLQDPGIHLELDNCGPHTSPAVRRRLLRPRASSRTSPPPTPPGSTGAALVGRDDRTPDPTQLTLPHQRGGRRHSSIAHPKQPASRARCLSQNGRRDSRQQGLLLQLNFASRTLGGVTAPSATADLHHPPTVSCVRERAAAAPLAGQLGSPAGLRSGPARAAPPGPAR